MQLFNLAGQPFITLNNLLKLEAWGESGGQDKQVIDAGLVTVDGAVELRRRCKVCAGQVVACEGK